MQELTESEKAQLESFDTMSLLDAVEEIDRIRESLKISEETEEPQIREHLIALHQQLFKVVNEGETKLDVCTVFDLVDGIEEQLEQFIQTADQIKSIVGSVNQLLPTSVEL